MWELGGIWLELRAELNPFVLKALKQHYINTYILHPFDIFVNYYMLNSDQLDILLK